MEDKSIILSFLKTLIMAEVSGGVMWKCRLTLFVDLLFVIGQEVGGRSGNGAGVKEEREQWQQCSMLCQVKRMGHKKKF